MTRPSRRRRARRQLSVLAEQALSVRRVPWSASRERIFRRVAVAARALRSRRAQCRRGRRGRRRFVGSLGAVSVVDLACGTGATLRALSPHLPSQQHWRLVDNDLGLLRRSLRRWDGRHRLPSSAGRSISCAISSSRLTSPLDLVTTSALLDLVSPEWLDRLVIEAAARRLPVYAALTYDGRAASSRPTLRRADALRVRSASANRQGLRPGARSGRERTRGRAASSISGSPSSRAAPIGCWGRPIGRCRMRCSRAGPMSRRSTSAGRRRMAQWLARRRSDLAAGPLALAYRSRRLFRPADRQPLSAEIAVEQHVAAEHVRPHRGTHRLLDALDRRQGQARSPGAENDRSDEDMQPVEAACGQEARERVGAAFHQNAAEAAGRERGDDRRRGQLAAARRRARRSRRRLAESMRGRRPVITSRRMPSAASARAAAVIGRWDR